MAAGLRQRLYFLEHIRQGFAVHPMVAILGPRQCGKTTLARMYAEQADVQPIHHFDLEDPEDLAQLAEPKRVLETLSGLVIIDEIQRIRELFPLLRVLVDKPHHDTRFFILGSASRDLIRESSGSLAGRITLIELMPFSYHEVGDLKRLWVRGGFPSAYLSKNITNSAHWLKNYMQTFLERDIPQLGIQIPAQSLRRFWLMLVHYHGHMFKASEIGRSLGISDTTAKRYLNILEGTLMVRILPPWHTNVTKRQIKLPKIYFRDLGLLHSLLGLHDYATLLRHPKLGISWEGFAMEEIIRHLHVKNEVCFFWGVHGQAELDLLVLKDGKKWGFEIKYSDAPQLNHSMQQACELLSLEKLFVIYPGQKSYSLAKHVDVIGLEQFLE
ncbi:MAG: hypothetical protein A3F17_08110 [Gammaproteobacteria bacterium RIFCSPHIGHO2_12_FULL_41_15]|nr:MAG: hypothetical protein A3F17_08110 [Gammaproteobacteria bacterium RIFCSPHIGHO2_12_FULL_41_15]